MAAGTGDFMNILGCEHIFQTNFDTIFSGGRHELAVHSQIQFPLLLSVGNDNRMHHQNGTIQHLTDGTHLFYHGQKIRMNFRVSFYGQGVWTVGLCKSNAVTLEDDINGDNPNVRLLDEDEKKELV